MRMEELVARSPVRVLEKSMHGGLGKGHIGVLASRKGVGKTACLVHIATDKLFQHKPVIHVSYASRVDHIINWYEDIFREIARSLGLESATEIHDEIIKNRVIMNFSQAGMKVEQVLRSLEAMIRDGNFAADTVIVDGYTFTPSSPEDLARFGEFAGRMGLEVWFSASLKGPEPQFDERGFPNELKCCLEKVDVLITLRHLRDQVQLHLLKDHDFPSPTELSLSFDPTTLLIAGP
ncbi:MAG: hypothetical protein JXE07_05380 [Candidatus Aminicenantes bacterium]|nr:hypothetical protein [Candidatus Aminicenantes bacterium]